MEFYNPNRILTMKDINGKDPDLYIVSGNRSAGKTTAFSKIMFDNYLEKQQKFLLLYRYAYEIDGAGEKFFKTIKNLFYPNINMTSKLKNGSRYSELYIGNGKKLHSCGYAIALNSSEQVKKNSSFFNDTSAILFDEFQSETNNYCHNEIQKFLSIYTSIARGEGKHIRHVPVYMLGNNISMLNPYYNELDISTRLQKNTKFLKGDGFIFEQNFTLSAKESQLENGVLRAFKSQKYVNYSAEGTYLNDNYTLIASLVGRNRYICTIKIDDKLFSIREFPDLGLLYCSTSIDDSHPCKICCSSSDLSENFIFGDNALFLMQTLRRYFTNGLFRFKNLSCKSALLKAISYK